MAQTQRPVMLVKFGSGGRPGTRANKFGAGCGAAIWLGTAVWAGSAVLLAKFFGLAGACAGYVLTYAIYWITMYWFFGRLATRLDRSKAAMAALSAPAA